MPRYFATHDGEACHGYGVKTDAAALCFWRLDPEGVSLWLERGQRRQWRRARAAKIDHGNGRSPPRRQWRGRSRRGHGAVPDHVRPSIAAHHAHLWIQRLVLQLWAQYGETILQDTEFIVELSPSGGVRPFSVLDDGYSNGTAAWPDMGELAEEIKRRTARPGIWIRPLKAPHDAAPGLLLPDLRFGERKDRAREFAYDPTVPERRRRRFAPRCGKRPDGATRW